MQTFAQYLLGSVGFGGIYALAALGLVLIFKATGVVNFAFGALASLVTLILWSGLHRFGLPVWGAWLVAVVAALVIGGVCEVLLLERMRRASTTIQIVLTLGLLLFVQGIAGIIWGYTPKGIPQVLNGQSIGGHGFFIAPDDIFIVGLTLFVALAMAAVFRWTRVGLGMRAVAADRETASLMGVPVRRYVLASWSVGVLITSLSAFLVAPTVSLSPIMMEDIAVFAFAAAVLGGFGSLLGAVVGGFLIGVAANLIAGYLSTNYQLTLVFVLIVVVLYLRPHGLFGRASTLRQ
ncbi:MAG: branched-chain amino acid ABC transporter permease [Marmoricola sp.]